MTRTKTRDFNLFENFNKKLIWLFVILWVFEGALRKWFLPALAGPLLLVREPIMIYLVLVGLFRGYIQNIFVLAIIFVSTFSLMTTLVFAHGNLFVGIYGWRYWAIYIPFIFMIEKSLTKGDVLRIGKFLLYLSVPMTLLIIWQFYSPQSAWVNLGVGGDSDGAGFEGALGYFRPSATFSFVSGYTSFQLITGCFLFTYLLGNKTFPRRYQIKMWILMIILLCYLLSIPYSISRTHFFQTIGILLFVISIPILTGQFAKKIIRIILLGAISIFLLLVLNLQGEGLNVFMARLQNGKSDSLDGVSDSIFGRYFGTAIDAFNLNFPFWGYGLGFGSNASKLLGMGDTIKYKYFNADQDWSVIIGENGIMLGSFLLIIKLSLCFFIVKRAYLELKTNKNIIAWMLALGVLLTLPLGNAMGNNPSSYGVMVLLAGFCLKMTSKKKKCRDKVYG